MGPPRTQKFDFLKKSELCDLSEHWGWFPYWPWRLRYHQTFWDKSSISVCCFNRSIVVFLLGLLYSNFIIMIEVIFIREIWVSWEVADVNSVSRFIRRRKPQFKKKQQNSLTSESLHEYHHCFKRQCSCQGLDFPS